MKEATTQLSAADRVTTTIPAAEMLVQENMRLRRQLAKQEDQLTILYAGLDQLVDEQVAKLVTLEEIDQNIHAQLDTTHVMNAVLDWAMRVTSAAAGTLYLCAAQEQPGQEPHTLREVARRGYAQEKSEQADVPSSDQEILMCALETGQAVQQAHICPDTAQFKNQQGRDHVQLALPIQCQGQPIGVLSLESAFVQEFNAAQIDSAMRLADHAAIAIQNALCHHQVNDQLNELLAVQQSCTRLTSCLNPDTLPDRIVQNALAVLQADRAAVYQYDSPTDSFSKIAVANRENNPWPDSSDTERTLVEKAAREQAPHFAYHSAAGCVAVIPLITEDVPTQATQRGQAILGVLYVAFHSRQELPLGRQHAIRHFAGHVTVALQNAGQVAHLRHIQRLQHERRRNLANQSRAPLTAIQGYARLMLEKIGGEITNQQREFLETILRNAADLETLLNSQPGA